MHTSQELLAAVLGGSKVVIGTKTAARGSMLCLIDQSYEMRWLTATSSHLVVLLSESSSRIHDYP